MIKAYSIRRIENILHHISILVALEGLMFFIPLIIGLIYNETHIMDLLTRAFIIPGSLMIITGLIVNRFTKPGDMQLKDAMFICTLTWIVFSILGAIPFIILADMSFIDSFFETMSGFTTTGITLLQGLDRLPHSILMWRALMQWIGGLGILSVFILIGFKGAAAVDKLFFSETHKIAGEKPHPGIFNTVKTLWKLYIGFTLAEMLILFLLGLGPFDALTHSLTTLATGGFSIHDSSIGYFRIAGYSNFNLIEITIMIFMMIGGINFLVHYNVLTGNIKSLWKNFEMKYFWIFLLGGITIITLSGIVNTGIDYHFDGFYAPGFRGFLYHLKDSAFQSISIMTTTGYATRDIGSAYFAAAAKQIFLLFMIIGGCSGSTTGGLKVIRVGALLKLVKTRIFKINTSIRTRAPLVIDGFIVKDSEIQRISIIFFMWMLLLFAGGLITALFSNLTAWQSFSGMFSALGNIGPCYIPADEMIHLSPIIKITYIIGMLAGRLEILPVILIFNRKFFR